MRQSFQSRCHEWLERHGGEKVESATPSPCRSHHRCRSLTFLLNNKLEYSSECRQWLHHKDMRSKRACRRSLAQAEYRSGPSNWRLRRHNSGLSAGDVYGGSTISDWLLSISTG